MEEKLQLHVVARYDAFLAEHTEDITQLLTIVAVVPTLEEAKSEVVRLNALRPDGASLYFWLPANYFPTGRGIRAPEPRNDVG